MVGKQKTEEKRNFSCEISIGLQQLEAKVSQRLRIIVILGKVNSSGDVCVNGDNTGSPEGMGTWGLVPTFLCRCPKHSGPNFISSIMISNMKKVLGNN